MKIRGLGREHQIMGVRDRIKYLLERGFGYPAASIGPVRGDVSNGFGLPGKDHGELGI